MGEQAIVVVKFGGTSVSTRERWERIEAIAVEALELKERPLIVCSALAGVSNLLEVALERALSGEHAPVVASIRATHTKLADALQLDAEALLAAELSLIDRLCDGVSLTREVSPRLQALIMACGELMSTRLGAAFLNREGGPLANQTLWRDARHWLLARSSVGAHEARHYLASVCDHEPNAVRRAELLEDHAAAVQITQGFIARDERGHTVLLGRGGSDTSAAYLAAILSAERLEIWTDVPGMFTANPHQVPQARLLKRLSYEEAQELASCGAKVLHPRCLAPLKSQGIPLHIRCTERPELEGTVIAAGESGGGARVKAISLKQGIPLISMETLGMWQQVGFLADVFTTFKRQGVSIDQVATSETHVTVTLDPVANALDAEALDELIEQLGAFCQAERLGPCAAVSLVGRQIRAILHELGPALEVFEQQQIYMVSQSSSDLNLTFVVAEAQAERLVRALHAMLFGEVEPDEQLGPSWRELFEARPGSGSRSRRARVEPQPWWRSRREELLELCDRHRGGALYVYDTAQIERQVEALSALESIDRLHYAIKANPHARLLELLDERGVRFECVSPGELDRVTEALGKQDAKEVLFTPNFAPISDYRYGLERGAQVTLDHLHPLEHHPELFASKELFLRLDPGLGRGHHKHVKTAGPHSKFGLAPAQIEPARALIEELGARVIGLHVHVGSGILKNTETWAQNAIFLAEQAERFEHVRVLDLGGGLGVPEKPGDRALDLLAVEHDLSKFKSLYGSRFELWLEPGRYLVAEAGVLLARVTQIKRKGKHAYIGVETGMNSLIRPSLYGAYHRIVNLTRDGAPMAWTADVVGPICESGDVLGYARRMPACEEGDVLLIATAGAYGHAMSSHYNLRVPAMELVI